LVADQDKFVEKLGGQADDALRNISAITKEAGHKILEVVKKTGFQNVDAPKKMGKN
jgi:enamine deaminase RidA (YjgF/YER057c/UK114 family)